MPPFKYIILLLRRNGPRGRKGMSVMNEKLSEQEQKLNSAPIRAVVWECGIPCALITVINALYNIVDQIFIGQGVGYLGTSATNVIFPLSTIGLSIGLLVGSGCAAMFSLLLGQGQRKRAARCVGNAVTMMMIVGVLFTALTLALLPHIVVWFGATELVYDYAVEYGRIICFGFAFYLGSIGFGNMLRADGRPKVATVSTLTGCVINCVLDPIFIFVFHWGVKGAAWATFIGQSVPFLISFIAIVRLKSVRLEKSDFVPEPQTCLQIISHGLVDAVLNLSITMLYFVNNNLLTKYGALSIYGSEIPLATAGIMQKFNHIITAVATGMGQGAQPLIGYCYGRRNIKRVKEAVRFTLIQGCVIGIVLEGVIVLFADKFLLLFGSESDLYMEFGVKCFRIFLSMAFLFAIQTTVSSIFMSLGKAVKGAVLSFIRNAVIPMSAGIILCAKIGVEGMLWEGPISGALAFILVAVMMRREWTTLEQMEAGGSES